MKSFLVASASCHVALPHIIRPILRVLKFVPKINHLSVSRIRSLHLLLEVIVHAEEECLVFMPLGTLDRIELLVQYQSIFFRDWVHFL